MEDKYRNAIFIVVYSKEKNKIDYLLLKRKLHWNGWEFPKGGVEKWETAEDAVRREIMEETGLKVLNIKKFPISGKYFYNKTFEDRPGYIGQSYSLYASEINKRKISIGHEHSDYTWAASEEAIKMLKWPNQKTCLMAVDNYLIKSNNLFRIKNLSSGKTIWIGKNEEQNEALVKLFIGEDNLIMHTVVPGSPFCVSLESLTEKEKKELAAICAAYSKDWRDNKSDVKVNSFIGKNVYKSKGMKTGTFGVGDAKVIIARKEDIIKVKK